MKDSQSEDAAMGMGSMMREVQELAEKFKVEEDEQYVSPYAHLEKATVLQEARIFHDPSQVRENPRKCCTVIAQLLHLQNTGQYMSGVEATEVFFGVTKLFMSDDASLRRMVYLFIKDVAETCDPDDVIIVTSCLTKDMTCDVDLYRGNALRVLVRIVDVAMLGAIERYVKQAIVDSSGQVASSALVSASHLFLSSTECAAVVRRWISEVQEATTSANEMVQFHAMQLLYQIKSHDRLGVSKLVSQFSTRNTLRSPMALVLLIRYTAKLLSDEAADGRTPSSDGAGVAKQGYQFLEASLRHKSELVVYEAARAICNLDGLEPQDLSPAISVLQLFLSSPKPATRYAAMRTLAAVANVHPRVVSKCNEDLEALIGDSNRSIATMAITTLLKTGSENSIDRLLKQISTFLTEIADEFKITVVRSLQKLCLTYPAKHRVLVGFLSNFLREEGGFDFKKSIVNSIISLIHTVPETTESSLLHLCEFIEDCEFTMLSTQILHLLGELGPTTTAPARYIRFIYNRVILENSAVRAAAVSALSRFAAQCPSLRLSIMTLLRRSLMDEDDETRDRAAIAVAILEDAMEKFPYLPPPEDAEAEDIPPDNPAADDTAAYVLLEAMPMSFEKLERSMEAYMKTPMSVDSPEPITFETLPIIEDTAADIAAAMSNDAGIDEDINGMVESLPKKKEDVDAAAGIYAIPELASLGRAFRSALPVPLTESETEYVVRCTKHIFQTHVVLQFTVQNTIEDQRLDNVTVLIDDSDSEVFTASGEIAVSGIRYGETKNCYTVLERNADAPLSPGHFTCELRFTVVQVDPATGEEEGDTFEEEYPLEDLEISTSDFMAKVTVADFRKAWEVVGNDNEVLEKFALQFKKMEDAVTAVVDFLGMQPCDGTGTVKPNSGGKPHMLHMSGVFVGGQQVLARAQIAMQGDNGAGVILKIAVRSEDANVSRMVADCIR
jgi:coatomer protein complex subunit gamma